jgi:hypothetical protein
MFLYEDLDQSGYVIVPDVLPPVAVAEMMSAVGTVQSTDSAREQNHRLYAMRNLLALVPSVRALADSTELRSLVEPALGPGARPVRGLLFDKTPGANWKVAWHQDLSIAVCRRISVPGFGPWSIKAGVQHVQPPVEVLTNMLTVRLHLDDCGPDNGPLKVLPGSHAAGVLSPEHVRNCRERVPPALCCVPAGGALLMRPLILHASSPATAPRHRRVIHLEYAAGELPGGVEWAEG